MNSYIRSPLKWPGGKYRLLDKILKALPPGKRLVEPFAGSGVVSLNAEYPAYLLCDLNEDLINFFQTLVSRRQNFISACAEFFRPACNTPDAYYDLRDKFNGLPFNEERAMIFLYLNRHGFNGLVRYNNKGKFNTPFGKYTAPYFPQDEMLEVIKKSKKTEMSFCVKDFKDTFSSLSPGDVVYCDPPYIPLSDTSNFTSYTSGPFGREAQRQLSACAHSVQSKGHIVVISNHDTVFSRDLYKKAKYESFSVQRFISCDGRNRGKAQEILATFS